MESKKKASKIGHVQATIKGQQNRLARTGKYGREKNQQNRLAVEANKLAQVQTNMERKKPAK
jgi:hypothetical protein